MFEILIDFRKLDEFLAKTETFDFSNFEIFENLDRPIFWRFFMISENYLKNLSVNTIFRKWIIYLQNQRHKPLENSFEKFNYKFFDQKNRLIF